MLVAFTICSNNYLAHAKATGDSFLLHHPEAQFIIGLVDKFCPSFDYLFFKGLIIVPVEDLKMPEFDEILSKYNIIELNTAVKPAYIHYIFNKYKVDKLLYIDPDILVESYFDEVLNYLDDKNIIITPHLFTPIDDDKTPTDHQTLGGGVFNLGFIGLSDYPKIVGFLNWWHDRVIKYGYAKQSESMFYDQLWINYVPCLYDNYLILKHPGYNIAHWNLHERYLNLDINNSFVVNNNFKLRFFHFSGYKFDRPYLICSYGNRFTFDDRPDLKALFDKYLVILKANRVDEIKCLPVFYYPTLGMVEVIKKSSMYNKFVIRLKIVFKVLIYGHL